MRKSDSLPQKRSGNMLWRKIRGGFMFGVAVIASPCCTPLIVPLVLAVLAGTPAAAWLTYHISWVYGSLTLISVISLVLGFFWLWQKKNAKNVSLIVPSKTSSNLPPVSLIKQTANKG